MAVTIGIITSHFEIVEHKMYEVFFWFVLDANQIKQNQQTTSEFDQECLFLIWQSIVIAAHKHFFFVWTISEYMNKRHIILCKIISFLRKYPTSMGIFHHHHSWNSDREETLSHCNTHFSQGISIKNRNSFLLPIVGRLQNSAKICKGTISSFDKKFEYQHSSL